MNSIYHEEQGKGPVLVFLHGFCENHEIWDDFIPTLSLHFKVITLDLPGFGESPSLKTAFTIKEVSQAVIAFLELLHIQKSIIIGHSLGGYIALALAEERPDLVEGLCLFNSTALADSEEKKLNRNKAMEFVVRNGVEPFVDTFVPGLFAQKDQKNIPKVNRIASSTSKNSLLAYLKAMSDRPDMTNFLKSFQAPILFIAGELDSFISPSSLEEQAKLSQKGRLAVLSKTGHMGMFEEPDKSINLLKDFANTCFQSATS
ncbi:MAG: alpha/beta hydrolase [Bacteroidia bacterium]|nr:alpha/beta hydrolase [Bacteroidia bacterium]